MIKTSESCNIELYIGSINEETSEPFFYEDLVRETSYFQDSLSKHIPVCITPVEFVSGSKYREKGWRVSVINFPRRKATPKEIERFMIALARVLMLNFKQKRICVVGASNTVMLESQQG